MEMSSEGRTEEEDRKLNSKIMTEMRQICMDRES